MSPPSQSCPPDFTHCSTRPAGVREAKNRVLTQSGGTHVFGFLVFVVQPSLANVEALPA